MEVSILMASILRNGLWSATSGLPGTCGNPTGICGWMIRLIGLSYRIERLRQEIRERFMQGLPGHAYAGVLAALAVGDQRAIPADQWQIFTRTGINHLMSISGLHVTMVSGLMFALVYGIWRRIRPLDAMVARPQSRGRWRTPGGPGLCAAGGFRGSGATYGLYAWGGRHRLVVGAFHLRHGSFDLGVAGSHSF